MGDKRAQEIVIGNWSSLGTIVISLVLLYFVVPETLRAAKADRSRAMILKVDHVEKIEGVIATQYVAHGTVNGRSATVLTGESDSRRRNFELRVYPIAGPPETYISTERHPGGPLFVHTPGSTSRSRW